MERIEAARLARRPQLEVRDLELVLALAHARSTAAAAPLLHLTQSAVSRSLAQAEDRVGVRLFERGARGLTPTAAGERLIDRAGSLLEQLLELERSLSERAAPPTRVRLVCECYTAYRWLPSAMAKLRQRTPDLEVEIAIEFTRAPMRALLEDEIDVALLTTAQPPRGHPSRPIVEPLFSDEVVFVMSTRHPLARARHVTPDDLRKHVLITSQAPPAEARWFVARVFGRRRRRLQFLRLPLTEAILDAARAGMGVAVLSEWIAQGYLQGNELTIRRLAAGPLRRPWRLAYRREAREAAQRLKLALVASAPRIEL